MDDLTARMAHANRLIDDEPRTTRGRRGHIGRLDRLCSVLTRVLPATGVGLSLLTDDNHGGRTVAASDTKSRTLEELQFTLGEGPCIDAYASRRPVLEPDLDTNGLRRWPGYAPAAQEQGVHAVFAFPLQVGAARAGALDVYRTEAGSLSAEALTQAVTFADVAMGLLIDSQARPATTGPPPTWTTRWPTASRSTRPRAWSWSTSASASRRRWPGSAPTPCRRAVHRGCRPGHRRR